MISTSAPTSFSLFLISSAPLGENYRFSERLVKLIYQSVILRLYNSFLFLDYTAKSYKLNKFQRPQKLSLLDQWIYSRLDLAYQRVINLMEKYELAKASREIIDFVADLSQWYIRRVKSEIKDKKTASAKCYVLRDILRSFVILSAPFLPYLSETIFQKIKYKNDPLSVHIVLIKERGKPNKQILDQMQKLRLAISQLLELRAKHKIKVRQPIGKAIVPWLPSSEEASIIKSEINAKEVKKGKEFYLDTKITQALLEEGLLRETTRQIQAVRKKMGIFYGQKAQFKILAPLKLKQFLNKNLKHLCSKTNSQILLGKGKEEIGSFKLLGEKIRIFKLE